MNSITSCMCFSGRWVNWTYFLKNYLLQSVAAAQIEGFLVQSITVHLSQYLYLNNNNVKLFARQHVITVVLLSCFIHVNTQFTLFRSVTVNKRHFSLCDSVQQHKLHSPEELHLNAGGLQCSLSEPNTVTTKCMFISVCVTLSVAVVQIWSFNKYNIHTLD